MNKISFPKFKTYDGQPVRYIQPKFDGHLVKIYREPYPPLAMAGSICALSKNDKDITDKLLAIDHINEELMGLPNDSQIFAELHCPGRFSTDVKTMLNAAGEDLRLTAFAAPTLGGVDQSSVCLSHAMKKLELLGLESTDTEIIWCGQAQALPPHNAYTMTSISKEDQDAMLADAVAQKLEGWVLKGGHLENWYKLKPTKTVDCFVTGTTMSESASFFGGLKSIDVAVYEQEWVGAPYKQRSLGTVGGGFEAAFRLEYDTDAKRQTLVGRVCEVEYDSLASGGKLRFPRFLMWRTDKDAEQCTSDQL